MSFCTHCGVPAAANARFCEECGEALEEKEPSNTSSPSAQLGAKESALPMGQLREGPLAASETAADVIVPKRTSAASSSVMASMRLNDPVVEHRLLSKRTTFILDSTLARTARGEQLTTLLKQICPMGEVLSFHGQEAHARTQQHLSEAIRTHRTPDYVCVLGSPQQTPHLRLRDDTKHDEHVLTDNFFGAQESPAPNARVQGNLLPEIPVSRIPFDDPDAIMQLIHRGPGLQQSWEQGVVVSCEVWAGATRAVAEMLQLPLRPLFTPPHAESHLEEWLQRRPKRLFFNVHGTDQAPLWVGEGGDPFSRPPVILRPDSIVVEDGAVVVSEACYGAAVFPDEDSISTTFLQRGASSFVGSSIIAWGPAEAPPGLADLIVLGCFAALDQGLSGAEALLATKREILNHYMGRDGGLAAAVQNTLLSFCHYGLPWTKVTGANGALAVLPAPTFKNASSTTAKSSAAGFLQRIRGENAGGGSGTLRNIRQRLQQKSAEQGWEVDFQEEGPLPSLAATLSTYPSLQRALGLSPTSNAANLHGVFRSYRTALGKRMEVILQNDGGRSKGAIADGQGNVLETFEARQGA